jgi:hypothetical protein
MSAISSLVSGRNVRFKPVAAGKDKGTDTMTKEMFQHRHYVAIAKVLADESADPQMVRAFASMFKADNTRFQGERFYAAARSEPINGRDRVRA